MKEVNSRMRRNELQTTNKTCQLSLFFFLQLQDNIVYFLCMTLFVITIVTDLGAFQSL